MTSSFGRRDAVFLSGLVAALAALCSPFLFSLERTAGNFGDVYAYHLPIRIYAASRLQEGAFPFWNPYVFGGEPLMANPQSALFYPVSAAFQLFPSAEALDWSLVGHLALAALGMQLLARRGGLGSTGACALAAGWSLSSFLLYRLPQGVPTLLYGLAFVPWTWLFADRPLLLGLCLALQFLSGHPQFMAANLAALALYLLVFRRPALRGWALACAVAFALSALQLLPTLEFLVRSVRVEWSTVFKTGYSLPWIALGTLVLPGMAGHPIDGSFDGPPSTFFELLNLYPGLLIVALAAVGLWRGGSPAVPTIDGATGKSVGRAGWGGPALLMGAGLFFALGEHNPAYRWLSSMPPLAWLRAPARWSIVFLWGVFLAAARGCRWASPQAPAWTWRAAALALLVLDLAWWGGRFVYGEALSKYMRPSTGVMGPLQADPLHRAATAPDLANPNKLMLYRVRNATGYEAFYLASAALHVSRSLGAPSADASRTYIDRIDNDGMEAFSVRWLLSMEKPGRTPKYRAGGLAVYENPDAKPLAYFVRGGAAELLRADPEHWDIQYRTGLGGPLVVSDADFPGWKAWLGERRLPVRPWLDFLKSVDLPPGDGVVRLRYEPRGWPLLPLLSAAALAGLALAGARRLEEPGAA